jgi:hypothetical protein
VWGNVGLYVSGSERACDMCFLEFAGVTSACTIQAGEQGDGGSFALPYVFLVLVTITGERS